MSGVIVQSVKYMIYVKDMDMVGKFYCDVFGFKKAYSSEYWTEIEHASGAIIGLHRVDDDISPCDTGLSFGVDDLGIALRVVEENSGVFERMLEDTENVKVARVLDTEKNAVSVVELSTTTSN
jgi:predicted enzyme related to lactoylglutathione lyase